MRSFVLYSMSTRDDILVDCRLHVAHVFSVIFTSFLKWIMDFYLCEYVFKMCFTHVSVLLCRLLLLLIFTQRTKTFNTPDRQNDIFSQNIWIYFLFLIFHKILSFLFFQKYSILLKNFTVYMCIISYCIVMKWYWRWLWCEGVVSCVLVGKCPCVQTVTTRLTNDYPVDLTDCLLTAMNVPCLYTHTH